jgi:serine/threonine-protein kinase PRP4
VHITKPTRDLRSRLLPSASTSSAAAKNREKEKEDEMRLITSFIDLLDKCLALDPARRITAKEALAHSFVRG